MLAGASSVSHQRQTLRPLYYRLINELEDLASSGMYRREDSPKLNASFIVQQRFISYRMTLED